MTLGRVELPIPEWVCRDARFRVRLAEALTAMRLEQLHPIDAWLSAKQTIKVAAAKVRDEVMAAGEDSPTLVRQLALQLIQTTGATSGRVDGLG